MRIDKFDDFCKEVLIDIMKKAQVFCNENRILPHEVIDNLAINFAMIAINSTAGMLKTPSLNVFAQFMAHVEDCMKANEEATKEFQASLPSAEELLKGIKK